MTCMARSRRPTDRRAQKQPISSNAHAAPAVPAVKAGPSVPEPPELSEVPEAGDRRQQGSNRRRHVRVLVDLEVNYKSEDNFLFAYIADISEMGIFVRTTSPEPAGTRLNLRFAPPGDPVIQVEGVVVWTNPFRPGDPDNINPGMGVQFVELGPYEREAILRLVRTFAYLNREDVGQD
jgi:type IV pilus assembly protein PilZ